MGKQEELPFNVRTTLQDIHKISKAVDAALDELNRALTALEFMDREMEFFALWSSDENVRQRAAVAREVANKIKSPPGR